MTLFNVILLNQPTQFILIFNIFMDIILLFLVYSNFCFNMTGTVIRYINRHKKFLILSMERTEVENQLAQIKYK